MGLVMSLAKRLHELQQIDLEVQKEQETLAVISNQLGESELLCEAKVELRAEEGILAEIDKQQRDIELDIEELQVSIAQVEEKLYSGKVKNPKELLSLEQEVNIFKVKLRQKEDGLLDLMTESEATQNKIKLNSERLKKLEGEWQQEQKVLVQRQAETQNQLLALNQKRSVLVTEISSEALELYEGVRLRKGQAVVRVEQGRCQGCRLTLPVNEWQQARTGALVQCSSCGRILYLS